MQEFFGSINSNIGMIGDHIDYILCCQLLKSKLGFYSLLVALYPSCCFRKTNPEATPTTTKMYLELVEYLYLLGRYSMTQATCTLVQEDKLHGAVSMQYKYKDKSYIVCNDGCNS